MPQDALTEYEAVVAEVGATSAALPSKMFGMPCLKIEGKAFAGLHNEAKVFKLRSEAHAEALALPGAHLFDPMDGRPMKEWVELPHKQAARWLEFARHALAYVGGERWSA